MGQSEGGDSFMGGDSLLPGESSEQLNPNTAPSFLKKKSTEKIWNYVFKDSTKSEHKNLHNI